MTDSTTGNDASATERYRQRPKTVVTDRGEGPPVVFAHGMLTDRTLFEPQLTALSETYRTIAYDLRARTDRYEGPYDLYALADDLAALLDALDIESIVLAGISMGGFMALRFIERYPEHVKGLILINSMAEAHTEREQEEYRLLAEQVREKGMQNDSLLDIARKKLFGKTTLDERPDLVEHWVDRWRTYPAEAVYHEMHSWIDRPNVTNMLSDITVPVLSVHGKENTVLAPERTTATLEALPCAQQELISAAGHSAPVERPVPVNHAVQDFLQMHIDHSY